MVALKTTPVNIDVPLQSIQQDLYEYIKAVWVLTDDDYECYGRCYRNYKESGYVPQMFTGGTQGKEYGKDGFYDDRKAASSFFGENSGRTVFSGQNQTSVHLIFWVNFDKVKTDVQHRADAEVHADVQRFLEQSPFVNLDNQIELITGIDRVFSEYPGWRSINNLKFSDMQPGHCFRFNFTVSYHTLMCDIPEINQPLN